MGCTKREWKVDIRVGVVAVYPDNETTRSFLPCIPDSDVCIFYKNGVREYNSDKSFKQWNVKDEDIANALLIAAAPELYEALKGINEQVISLNVQFSQSLFDAKKKVRTALAKAEGK